MEIKINKAFLYLSIFTAIVVSLGYFIGGGIGVLFSMTIALLLNFVSYFFSDRLVIALSRGEEVTKSEMPWLHEIVEDITGKAGIVKPKVYLLPELQPNAFATGRNQEHAVIGVTAGLLKLLDKEEIRTVIAHEMTHIKYNDILISTIAATLASAVSILAHILYGAISSQIRGNSKRSSSALMDLAFFLFAPILAAIVRTAISRNREYAADKGSVELTGDKENTINALLKIDEASKKLPLFTASPSTAHMYISNPLRSKFLQRILSTHPPIEDRVARIKRIEV